VRSKPEMIVAVISGQIMSSEDGGQHWRPGGLGKDGQPVNNVVADAHVPKRVWAARAGRVYASDELGSSWRAAGRALPAAATPIRGMQANAEPTTLVVTTNRGLYRSEDGWCGRAFAGRVPRSEPKPGTLAALIALHPNFETSLWVLRPALEAEKLEELFGRP